jgi:hypothetical protein
VDGMYLPKMINLLPLKRSDRSSLIFVVVGLALTGVARDLHRYQCAGRLSSLVFQEITSDW